MNMMFAFLLALFPFLHDQRYTVTYHSCEKEKIIVAENDTLFEIRLFNLKITEDEGWETVCSLLEEADTITFEVDATTKISEPLPVYLFTDGELVQERLIRQGSAYTQIHNPEYRYEKELLKLEESTSTMAITSDADANTKGDSQGWIFLLIILMAWLCTIGWWYYRLRKWAQEKEIDKVQ